MVLAQRAEEITADAAGLEKQIAELMGESTSDNQSAAPVLRDEDKKATLFDLAMIWSGANIIVGTWAVGALATAVFGLDLMGAVWALLVGNILGGAALGITSTLGKVGAPQMLLSRYSMGIKGAKIPSFFNFLSNIGWFAANTVLVTLATFQVFELLHVRPGTIAKLIVLAIIVVLQIYLGLTNFNLMKKVEAWLVIPMAILVVYMTFKAFSGVDWGGGLPPKSFAAGSSFNYWTMWISAVGAIGLGYLGAWAPYAADFTRFFNFKKKGADQGVFWVGLLVGGIVALWLELIGAAFATVQGGADPALHIAKAVPGFAIPALIIVLGGLVSTNILNLINGGLSAKAVWKTGTRVQWTWIIGIVGSIMAVYSVFVSDVASMYHTFLIALLIWEAPWLALLLVDYFYIRKQDYRIADLYQLNRVIPDYDRAGVTAYATGFIAAMLFSFTGKHDLFGVIPLYSPLMLKYFNGGDISYFVGFIVAGVVYLAMARPQVKQA